MRIGAPSIHVEAMMFKVVSWLGVNVKFGLAIKTPGQCKFVMTEVTVVSGLMYIRP